MGVVYGWWSPKGERETETLQIVADSLRLGTKRLHPACLLGGSLSPSCWYLLQEARQPENVSGIKWDCYRQEMLEVAASS